MSEGEVPIRIIPTCRGGPISMIIRFKALVTNTTLQSFKVLYCVAISFAISSGISGCKGSQQNQQGTSETKSLDNFAAGTTVRQNACQGSYPVALDDGAIRFDPKYTATAAEKAELRSAVKSYLSAVPTDMQNIFKNWGGSVLITPEANAICTKLFADRNEDRYVHRGREDADSCYIYAEAGQGKAYFTIVHKPDREAIRHGGVRVFGYMFSQFFPRLVNADDTSQSKYRLVREPSTQVSALKLQLSQAFLQDMVAVGRYDLRNLDTFLGDGGGTIVRRNIAEGKDPLAGVRWAFTDENSVSAAASQLRRSRFEDFVFAEAFDSFRCSSQAKQSMKSEFPQTFAAFIVADRILTGSQTATAALTHDSDPGETSGSPVETSQLNLLDGSALPEGLAGSSIKFYPVGADGKIDLNSAITPTGPQARNGMADVQMWVSMLPQFMGLAQTLGQLGAQACPGGNCAGGGCCGGSCGSCGG